MEDITEWIKARVLLPQWLKTYQSISKVNWFKIAFRTHPYETAIPILELYMNQYHGGNYLDLWPTIKRLGDTDEPADVQYISCEKLDELGFLEHFIKEGERCNHRECGVTCFYCDEVIKKVEIHKDA